MKEPQCFHGNLHSAAMGEKKGETVVALGKERKMGKKGNQCDTALERRARHPGSPPKDAERSHGG